VRLAAPAAPAAFVVSLVAPASARTTATQHHHPTFNLMGNHRGGVVARMA
jgi:hypothetical protein